MNRPPSGGRVKRSRRVKRAAGKLGRGARPFSPYPHERACKQAIREVVITSLLDGDQPCLDGGGLYKTLPI